MNKKHQRTLEAIFKLPVQSNVVWKDIEALMRHLNTEITEGEGSRVRFSLNGIRAQLFIALTLKRKLIKELWYQCAVSWKTQE